MTKLNFYRMVMAVIYWPIWPVVSDWPVHIFVSYCDFTFTYTGLFRCSATEKNYATVSFGQTIVNADHRHNILIVSTLTSCRQELGTRVQVISLHNHKTWMKQRFSFINTFTKTRLTHNRSFTLTKNYFKSARGWGGDMSRKSSPCMNIFHKVFQPAF